MSSSAPPILPVSGAHRQVPGPHTGIPNIQIQAPLQAFISTFSDAVQHSFSQRRPWTQLIDRNAFSRPINLSEAVFRIHKNFTFFKINYYTIGALIFTISLLSNPVSLVALISLLAAWIFLYFFRPSDQPLVVFNRVFTDFEILVILFCLSLCVVFLTNVGSILFSSLLICMAVVCVHGAMRVPEDMFMEPRENLQPTGYVSIVRGNNVVNVASLAAAYSVPSPATPLKYGRSSRNFH